MKLTDDDYAHTDLFKQLRSQYDDVVKRINHLEATNVQLREEAEKYRSERNAYKLQLEEESNATIAEKEAALMRAESDLARIRNTRDELFADQQIRKNAQDQEKTAAAKLQELADAREARIAALESEIERLRLQIEGSKTAENVDDIPLEELRSKYTSLERQYSMLNTELASMQTAYKKFSTLASQKVTDFGVLEEKVARLTAEKSKADQKYFAAMKSKEARDLEVRTLRMQNSKTSDIVSQLKESEAATRSLISNMDKQVSETKEALNSALEKHRVTQQQLTESNIVVEGLKNQVAELKNISTSKDATLGNTSTALRQAETEIAGLKQTLSDTKKSLDNWKNKSLGNNSSEYEMLRVSLHLPHNHTIQTSSTNLHFRHLHFARFAAATSRIRSSKHAVTSSARTASRNVSPRDLANVPIAIGLLVATITCTSPCDLSNLPLKIFFLYYTNPFCSLPLFLFFPFVTPLFTLSFF